MPSKNAACTLNQKSRFSKPCSRRSAGKSAGSAGVMCRNARKSSLFDIGGEQSALR